MANPDLIYLYEDGRYEPLQAYRGAMWFVRNRYKKDQDARTFLRKHTLRSENTGTLNLIRFPDGSVHIGYYILLNELDLLEEAIAKDAGK